MRGMTICTVEEDVIASADPSAQENSAEAVTVLFRTHLVLAQFAFKLGYLFHKDAVTCKHALFFGFLGLFFFASQSFLNFFKFFSSLFAASTDTAHFSASIFEKSFIVPG